MIQKLSSVKFAFYNLILMIFLMGAGVGLHRFYKPGFNMMNEIHIFEWLHSAPVDSPILLVWFILLCISAAMLFINAVFCTFAKQVRMAVKSKTLKKWLFLILHCMFIIVLFCHGLSLVIGSKKSNVIIYPGRSIVFNNIYKIQVSKIVFQDDINILKAGKKDQRILMTKKNINKNHNFVEISLFKDSNFVKTKKLMMLSPLKYNDLRVTLIEFILKDNKLGAKLTISRNSLTFFFFTIYALMILTLGLYSFLSFKNSHRFIRHSMVYQGRDLTHIPNINKKDNK